MLKIVNDMSHFIVDVFAIMVYLYCNYYDLSGVGGKPGRTPCNEA